MIYLIHQRFKKMGRTFAAPGTGIGKFKFPEEFIRQSAVQSQPVKFHNFGDGIYDVRFIRIVDKYGSFVAEIFSAVTFKRELAVGYPEELVYRPGTYFILPVVPVHPVMSGGADGQRQDFRGPVPEFAVGIDHIKTVRRRQGIFAVVTQ